MDFIFEYLKRFCFRQGLSQRHRPKTGNRLSASALAACLRALLATFLCALFTMNAYAGPFTCDGEIYQVQSGQLRIFDAISSSYVDVGPKNNSYNATGFNTVDNFAYGAQGQDVIRIHSDGTIEDVFTNIGFGSFSGDVDNNNTLWLRRANNRYIGIDLATGAQTDITFSGTLIGVADAAFFADSGTRYLIGYAAGDTSVFNLDTETVVRRNVTGLPAGAFGATWTDFNGRIFTFNNTTGGIYEIFDPLSPAPYATLAAQGDPSGNNDGFSCNRAPFPNLPPLAFDDDYVTPLDTAVASNVISNANSSQDDEDPEGQGVTVTVLPVSGTGPSNGSVTFSPNGDFTYTPDAGFFGTDTFDYTITDATGLTATATVTILIEKPEITLTKVADPVTADIGDVVTYTYTVTNSGNVDVSDLNVTDVHSGSGALSAITPANASLSGGDVQVFTATYTVTEADIIAGTDITNIATARGSAADGTLNEPTADASVSLTAPTPEALFSKIASPDTGLNEGDTVTYTYTVENTGNVTLTDTSVSDQHFGEGTLSAITPAGTAIAPGDSQTYTSTYVITQADIDAGTDIPNTATLNTTPAGGTLAPLTADEAVFVTPGVAAATLTKTADQDTNLSVGQTVTYEYEVTNTGTVTLIGASITDAHSGSGTLSAIMPSTADLAPGDSRIFTATYTITQADVDEGVPVTNTATLSATSNGGDVVSETADESVTLEAPLPDLDLVKTASDTADVAAGDVITYSYEVDNVGNVTMTNVIVSDVHSGTGTLSAITPATADLAPGDNQVFTATYTVTQADIDAGTDLTNTATADATPESGTYTPVTDDETVTVEAPAPEMTLAKTASETTNVAVGDVITYSYEVENTGNVGMTGVSISDAHSGTGSLSAITPANVDLAPGESQLFTATYTVTQADIDAGADITNTATADGTPEGGIYTPVTDDETVTVEAPAPDMTLTKTASDTTNVALGDVITYSYEVENTGNVGMTAVSISDAHSGSGTLSAIMPASVDLAPGDSQIFTATYTVTQDDVDAGADITNTATADATPEGGTYTPVTDDETVTVEAPAPSMTLAKTASDTADVAVGDVITYSYEVENTGNVGLNTVAITDVHSGTGTLSAISPVSVSLAPGEMQIFTATYTVTQADIDAGSDITNTATADAEPVGGTLTPVTDDETVTVEAPAPNMTLTKTASDTTDVAVGDMITYSYEVVNIGNVGMTDVTISDAHSGTGTLSAITPAGVDLAIGASQIFTATYTVTQDDIDAGADITNTATANGTPDGGTYTPVTDDEIVAVETAAPGLSLVKTASQTSDVQIGDVIIYTYVVTNTGNVNIADVAISDDHTSAAGTVALPVSNETANAGNTAGSTDAAPDTGIWDLLAPGDAVSFTSDYTVTEADAASGNPVTNIATATGEPAGGILTDPVANESVTVSPPRADLSITKTNSPGVNAELDQAADTLTSGSVTTYTLTVTNNGPDGVDGAVVNDVVGSGLTCTGTDSVTLAGDGVPAGSYTVADLTGAGITLGRLEDTEAAMLSYSCIVN